MNPQTADPLPGKEREKRQRYKQQRVLDCALTALIDVHRLVQIHAESRIRQCGRSNRAVLPRLAIRAVQFQYLPARLKAVVSDLAVDRQERALKRWMRPIR